MRAGSAPQFRSGRVVQSRTSLRNSTTNGLIPLVGEAGLEPTTPGLEGRCSIQLSYSPVTAIVSSPGAEATAREHP